MHFSSELAPTGSPLQRTVTVHLLESVNILRHEVSSHEYRIAKGAARFVNIVNEGSNYYSKPRNLCCKRNADARLNKGVLVFVLQGNSGLWSISCQVISYYVASQKVSWLKLLAVPVKQTIMVIATN